MFNSAYALPRWQSVLFCERMQATAKNSAFVAGRSDTKYWYGDSFKQFFISIDPLFSSFCSQNAYSRQQQVAKFESCPSGPQQKCGKMLTSEPT